MSDKWKASSVDWFYQQIRDHGAGFTAEDLFDWHKKAKSIHEKEIKKAWDHGFSFTSVYQSAKEYYDKTFNND